MKVIEGGNKKSELAESVRELESQMDLIVKSFEIQAKIIKAKYDSYIKEGFTPQQALELIK